MAAPTTNTTTQLPKLTRMTTQVPPLERNHSMLLPAIAAPRSSLIPVVKDDFKFSPRVLKLMSDQALTAHLNAQVKRKREEEEVRMMMHNWSVGKSRRTATYNETQERRYNPHTSR